MFSFLFFFSYKITQRYYVFLTSLQHVGEFELIIFLPYIENVRALPHLLCEIPLLITLSITFFYKAVYKDSRYDSRCSLFPVDVAMQSINHFFAAPSLFRLFFNFSRRYKIKFLIPAAIKKKYNNLLYVIHYLTF